QMATGKETSNPLMAGRYLKGKPKLGLWYPRESAFDLEAYSDSDYAGANLDRKSTTGGCQFLGRRLISWQCKKKTIVATSTTEAEYVAAASYCGQILWIQNQMLDYGFNFINTKIYIDNESTICIVKNPMFHSKTKHTEIRHHFIRDAYEKKLIQVLKIHIDDNVADLLTKAFDTRLKGMLSFIELWTFYHAFIHLGQVSSKMRSLGKENVSKQGRKKAKTGTNIEECTNYVVNEGSYADKKELNMRQRRWIELLSDYDCEIRYRPNRMTKSAHFLPMKKTDGIEKLAQQYLKEIVCRHGVSVSIISDKDIGIDTYLWSNSPTITAIIRALRLHHSRHSMGESVDRYSARGVICFGKRGKLSPRYIRPFEIIKRIGLVAYKLELPEKLRGIHNTLYVSNLKKCLVDENLVIPLEKIQLDDKLHFIEEPMEIIDREVKQLKQSRISIVKVRWNSRRGPEYT
nr:putative ribonuclease H-like domain-containing protein [Tanacetum cinerariifolium]